MPLLKMASLMNGHIVLKYWHLNHRINAVFALGSRTMQHVHKQFYTNYKQNYGCTTECTSKKTVLRHGPLVIYSKGIGLVKCLSIKRHCSSGNTETIDSSEDKDIQTSQAVSKLIDRATKKDVMIKSVRKDKLIVELNQLINQGYPVDEVYVLCRNTKVFYNLPQFIQLVKTLLDIGYRNTDIPVLIKNKPSMMELSSDEFMIYFKNLNSVGLVTKSIVRITTKCPKVLDIDPKKMQYRITELREIFKSKDVFTLIDKSPHVLYDDMDSMMEKFAYVTQEMGITQRQIMYSKLFDLPLDHLHARHMFLVRTGFFRKVVNDKQVSDNPSLDEIINTSDKAFLEKFGGLSIEEYEVFKALLKKDRIISNQTDNAKDGDSDDDT